MDLTPSRIWAGLDAAVRREAARSLFSRAAEDRMAAREATGAIAATLRFREASVRRLPLDKRVDYLARAVRPDDSLASQLLLALHLGERRELLTAFLDALEIPHSGGAIADDFELAPPGQDRLRPAVARLHESFPQEQVELYLATLVAMDPDVWAELSEWVGETGSD